MPPKMKRMPRPKQEPTKTIRAKTSVASELEVIAEYLADTTNKTITVGDIVAEQTRAFREKHKAAAVAHKQAKLQKLLEPEPKKK